MCWLVFDVVNTVGVLDGLNEDELENVMEPLGLEDECGIFEVS